eukprot:TRINITY_DN1039_c0_g2_i1.p1 TRINITY_DN1039_c0_g2~~TRINITY_DN1039_c0_g2_i1.p1  ORF type:complete len:389 (-),score=64.41 TRINITY_DN1039_c0_g2_i1:101-1267(-)
MKLFVVPETPKQRHALGVFLVVIVVLIWVTSSIAIQMIFTDADFDKPFFLTYMSTSMFSLYLSGFLIFRRKWTTQNTYTMIGAKKETVDNEESVNVNNADNLNNSSSTTITQPSSETMLSIKEVIKLASIFCPIWFVANYAYNVSLALTSVSSNTILSTLSGLFTLTLSSVLRVDKFTVGKLIASLITLGGVVMVSVADSKDNKGSDTFWGDMLAIFGAFVYALYCTLLKKMIGSEERVRMPMFFGFLGAINFVCLMPFFWILNATRVEAFEWPKKYVFLALFLNGLFGTVLSDLLEAWSVLLTTPLINTLGLSLTIPIAMLSDLVRKDTHFNVVYIFGGLMVILGFVLVNLSSSSNEERFQEWSGKVWKSFVDKVGLNRSNRYHRQT